MKNVTIRMDDDTAQWLRVQAAHRGTSVSRLIGQILREHREQDAAYVAAMRRFLSRPAQPLKQTRDDYPDRGDTHDRPVLR